MVEQKEFFTLEKIVEDLAKAEKAVGRGLVDVDGCPHEQWQEILENSRKCYRAFYEQMHKMRMANLGIDC